MDQPLELLLRHLDDNRAALWDAVDCVPSPLIARRPAPESWSVAEVLEHLLLLERRVGVLLERHVATIAEREGPALPIESVDALIDTGRLLDRSRKITTGDSTQPRGSADATQLRVSLEESRRTIRETVERCDGLAIETISIPHVILGPINLYQWIAFVGTHEARHTAQIREAATLLARVGPA